MLHTPIVIDHLSAQHAAQFCLALLAMRAQRVEQRDVTARHAGLFELGQHDRQDAIVGRWPRDVAMRDHHSIAGLDERREGR